MLVLCACGIKHAIAIHHSYTNVIYVNQWFKYDMLIHANCPVLLSKGKRLIINIYVSYPSFGCVLYGTLAGP